MHSIEFFPWNESFNSGIEITDNHNRHLAELLNSLIHLLLSDPDLKQLGDAFDEFDHYAVYHFQEEQRNDATRFHHATLQMDHADFVKTTNKLKKQTNAYSIEWLLDDALPVLSNWLVRHILEQDKSRLVFSQALNTGMSQESARQYLARQISAAGQTSIAALYATLSRNTLQFIKQFDKQIHDQAQNRLHESEQRFALVADAAPILIWLSGPDKLYNWFNAVWLEFTGRRMEQEIGDGWFVGVHPDDLQYCREIYSNHFNRREPFYMEYRLKRHDGEYRWIHDNGVPRFSATGNFEGFIGSCLDITDRKLDEQKIAAQNLRYQTLLKSSTEGIHILDWDGNIVNANEAFCRQLGYSLEQGLQLNVREFDAQFSDHELTHFLRELIQSGEARQFESQHRRLDGNIIDVDINAIPAIVECRPLLFCSARDITERKRLDAVLRANEQKLRGMYELSPLGFAVANLNGQLIEFNKSFQRISQYSDETLLQRNYWALPPARYTALKEVQLNTLLATGCYGPCEMEYLRQDGSLIPIRLNSMLVPHLDGQQYIWSIIEDISDWKKAEQVMQASELFAKATIDAVSAHICVLDKTGKILAVNKAWKDFHDRNAPCMHYFHYHVGENYIQICDLADGDFSAEAKPMAAGLRSIIAGERDEFTLEYPCFNENNQEWFIARVTRFHGDSGNLVVAHENITERKRSEAALNQAKKAAETLAQSKADFLANMSHEIRTPMNAIIGLTQLALNQLLSLEIRDKLEKINSSSVSLLGILNDILDFSKIDANQLSIEQAPFNLDNIIENLYQLFSISAEEKNLLLSFELSPEIPRALIGDARRIQQILSNLIGNAIKFTEQGKVVLQLTLLKSSPSQVWIEFSVHDTGIGLSKSHQANLFQPFTQADTSITRRFGGTGLGLAISRRLLQMMESDFHIESNLGLGSTFSFKLLLGVSSLEKSLPKSAANYSPPSGALSAELAEHGKLLSGAHILVVEDNRINQTVISEFLQLSGVIVDIANNGKEAVAAVMQENYDAVLMDVQMPEMDGVEATRQIREQPQFQTLPIIALTAGVTFEERERCKNSGMDDFIAKPVNSKQLVGILSHWLGNRQTIGSVGGQNFLDNLSEQPDFDFDNILAMLGGNQELLLSLLRSFRDEIDQHFANIVEQFQRNDLQAAAIIIHTIKGSAANLGIKQVYNAAETLNTTLKLGKLDQMELDNFKRALAETKLTLTKL